MIETLIKFLLARLAGITARQWAAAIQWVIIAGQEPTFKTGGERREAVLLRLRNLWPELGAVALNLLIETAVAFSRKR
jgi:hypothetical protein